MNAKQDLARLLLDLDTFRFEHDRADFDEMAFSVSVSALSTEARALADRLGLLTVIRTHTWEPLSDFEKECDAAEPEPMPVVHPTDEAVAVAKQMNAAALAAAAALVG